MKNFKRIKSDANGNPRYVTSWCKYGFKTYAEAVKAANSIGGSRYNTKSFAGGLVFQSYECELDSIAKSLTEFGAIMKFITGKTYVTRSIGDHDCIIRMEVLSRTEKTIKTNALGKAKTLRIGIYNGIEFVKPWGSYSMAPIMTAEKVVQS